MSAVSLVLLSTPSDVGATELQDPTRPGTAAPAATEMQDASQTVPTLQTLLISGDRRLAIIDDRLVQEGGRVAGHTVQRIHSRGVVVSNGKDAPFELRLGSGDMKKEDR